MWEEAWEWIAEAVVERRRAVERVRVVLGRCIVVTKDCLVTM